MILLAILPLAAMWYDIYQNREAGTLEKTLEDFGGSFGDRDPADLVFQAIQR